MNYIGCWPQKDKLPLKTDSYILLGAARGWGDNNECGIRRQASHQGTAVLG